MIRLAFIGVLALGGLFAFAAFFLVRGTEGDVPQITAAPQETPAPQTPETPQVDRLYYLRDIAFDQGEITVMLLGAGPGGATLIIRDQDALMAAKDAVFVNTTTSGGQAAGSFVLSLLGAPPNETVVQVFRNDSLIAAVSCTNTSCGSFADSPDLDYAELTQHATPYSVINDSFDDHATYLDTILAVSEDPNFMLLDQRPREDFPAEPIIPHLVMALPTVVTPLDAPLDQAAHRARVEGALADVLPADARIASVTLRDLGTAVLADKDNNQPVTAGGAPITFPGARFYDVTARVEGLHTLPSTAFDQLTDATVQDFNVDTLFAEFVTERLQTTCVDCYFLKVDGPVRTQATAVDWRTESYYLDYYDLRDAP